MRTKQKALSGLLLVTCCAVAYWRAPRATPVELDFPVAPGAVHKPERTQHRFRVVDGSGKAIPHTKVTWCAPGWLMSGGLTDLCGVLDVQAPVGFLGAVTFHANGETFHALMPDEGELGRLCLRTAASGIVAHGVFDDDDVDGAPTRLIYHQVHRGCGDGARGERVVVEGSGFQLSGIIPGMPLILGAVGSLRDLGATDIRWQPTIRREWDVPTDGRCCFDLGRLDFSPPNLLGRVIDDKGQPIADAMVTYRPVGTYLSPQLQDIPHVPFGGAPPTSRTNARGEFAFFVSSPDNVGVVDITQKCADGSWTCREGLKVVCTQDADDNKLTFIEPLENRP